MLEWQSILRSVAKTRSVRHVELRKIPQLKTCDNWREVAFLGRVRYEAPNAVYDGGLVQLGERIYYISARQIQTVGRFAKFRNLDRIIAVLES
jgi:hypothetical protein